MGKCRSLENQMKHACSDAMSLGEQKRRYARATGATKKEALDYANHQLGHGDNRRDLSDRYVQNQW